VITIRPAGDAALLLETGPAHSTDQDGNAAAAIAAFITAADLPGLIDVVPGAATVLVSIEPGSWSLTDLAARLTGLAGAAASGQLAVAAGVVTIEVCYDGPDLAEVAALTGLSAAGVIARHQAAEYRVGWLGFAPGFGYLTGLDPLLAAVPRLASPRLRVPAGSVAIAGGLAAVYPAASPGGWRLLGRSTAPLWDPDRDPPALLAPGVRVRFRVVDSLPPVPGRPAPDPAAGAPSGQRRVQVLKPGPFTTVQDLGRPGLAHLGVPASGAADAASLQLANSLVGNEPGAACLEVTLGRLALRFDSDALVAVTGAPAPIRVDDGEGPRGTGLLPGDELAVGMPIAVAAGSVVRLGAPPTGLRSYVAIDGGIGVRPVLGSRSADSLSGLGPAPLRPGEWLPLERPRSHHNEGQLRRPRAVVTAAGPVGLRVIAGPRDDWFAAAALDTLAGSTYVVSPASNRTGLRLTGPELRRGRPGELLSEGVATGSLQVTHDGQPILLLADHPTTGGYPVIAVVATADLGLAAQLRPGQQVRFRVSREPGRPPSPGSAG
jgi:KipI family sensor histidine kinase inhibitor